MQPCGSVSKKDKSETARFAWLSDTGPVVVVSIGCLDGPRDEPRVESTETWSRRGVVLGRLMTAEYPLSPPWKT